MLLSGAQVLLVGGSPDLTPVLPPVSETRSVAPARGLSNWELEPVPAVGEEILPHEPP